MIDVKDYSKSYVTRCASPVFLKNRYTHEPLMIGCGKCPSCLNAKSDSMASRLDIESRNSKYTFFITLTYTNEYLPRLRFRGDWGEPYVVLDPQVKLTNRGNIVPCDIEDEVRSVFGDSPCALHLTENEYLDALQKSENNKYPLSYVCKEHAQKFIKRLRINAFRRYGAELRYYIVSEYGPTRLRAHYHALIFTDNKELAEDLAGLYEMQKRGDGKGLSCTDATCNSVLFKAWRYGRIGCERITSSASSYCAGYVTANSRLPKIYRFFERIKPFALYSRRPTIGVPAPTKGEILKALDGFRNGEIVQRGNKYVLATTAYQTLCNYFPRVSGFNRVDNLRLNQRYHLAEYVENYRALCGTTHKRRFACYLDRLKDNLGYTTDEQVLADFYISRRAMRYASVLGVTLDCYINHYIRRAWSNYELYRLSDKYAFQESEFDILTPVERVYCNSALVAHVRLVGIDDLSTNVKSLIKSYGITPSTLLTANIEDSPVYKGFHSMQTSRYNSRDKSKKINSKLFPNIL